MLALYSLVIFVSAFLLFSLEPMVGKMLLPRCGGTPAVWNTCMVFFQVVLLLGYAYTHASCLYLGVRRQAVLHLIVVLLPLAVLPVLFGADLHPPTGQDPSLWLLGQLTLVVGLPFFVVSTTAPLLQRWFTGTDHAGSRDPYFLYSTSNAGSLLALASYPFLIEPWIGLYGQSHLWAAGYIVLIVLLICCAVAVWRSRGSVLATRSADAEKAGEPGPAIGLRQRLLWILLALVPSSLMLGVTTHIATDIASVPLLWMIPLALYLLTFVIVFARKPPVSHALMIKVMAYVVILMPLFIFGMPLKFWIAVPVHLLAFWVVAMVCHGELARNRPGTSHLTEFYLLMSLGGVLGGLFNTLVAPQVFNSVIEYPLMLVVACLLRPSDKPDVKQTAFGFADLLWLLGLATVAGATIWTTRRLEIANPVVSNLIVFGIPAVACFEFRHRPVRFAIGLAVVFLAVSYFAGSQSGNTLFVARDFFGVKRVCLVMGNQFHALVNGNTTHGLQKYSPAPDREPLAYYCRSGPIGDIFAESPHAEPEQRVAVIGLGAGSLASYARPGDRYTFYEIDPVVARIATDPRFFTFLETCEGKSDIVLGDARIELSGAADHEFDMMVLDAFSSDSIPMHLLTQEAMRLYCTKLKENGLLVLHISNRYMDLEPVLAQLAADSGLVCLSRPDLNVSAEETREGKNPSQYLVMAHREQDLRGLQDNPRWRRLEPSGRVKSWTDDYSNIVDALRW